MVLKRKLGPKTWAMEAIMEAVCKGRGSGSLGRRRSSRICHELATIFCFILATIIAAVDHDRTTIGRRSGVDRAPDPR